jgi:ribonucleotide reductase beta subunit family protein with ferritin-like domain
MIGDPDENYISNKELHDFMKAMSELLTKNQAFTTTTYPSIISYYILTSLPSYDGFDLNKYFAGEIEMDEIFEQRRICERRKLKNVASVLTNNVLVWWKHLFKFDKLPKTWNDVKILMRIFFC